MRNKLNQSQVLDLDEDTQDPWFQQPMYDDYDEVASDENVIVCTKCGHIMYYE